MTESNPGGRRRTELRGWAGLRGGGGEGWAPAAGGPGGLVRSASWPRGLGIGPVTGAGQALQGVVARGFQSKSCEEGNRGDQANSGCFLLECFLTSRPLLFLKVLGVWATARIVGRCLFSALIRKKETRF